MILGFLGKGGSGKSTLSYRYIQLLNKKEEVVLAVDADHNMDLTYNLGVNEEFNYMGGAQTDIRVMHGAQEDDAPSALALLEKTPTFTISPKDAFTQKYSYSISPNLSLMTAGPHTDDQLYGQACSHWLTTAIKVYLPHVSLKEREHVVVDERAGVDGVGTGMTLGWHAAIIVAEATEHGIKAANQIAKMVSFFGTPYEFALNKVRETDDVRELHKKLIKPALFVFMLEPAMTRKEDAVTESFEQELEKIYIWEQKLKELQDDRLERTKEKVRANKNYEEKRGLIV